MASVAGSLISNVYSWLTQKLAEAYYTLSNKNKKEMKERKKEERMSEWRKEWESELKGDRERQEFDMWECVCVCVEKEKSKSRKKVSVPKHGVG